MTKTFGSRLSYHTPQREFVMANVATINAIISQPVKSVVMQPVYHIRDQGRFPACEGAAHASCFDTESFIASGFDIWRDARRRQGDLSNPHIGTFDNYARESVCKLGVIEQRHDEFLDTPNRWTDAMRMPSLKNQIDGFERRKVLGDTHSINPWAEDAYTQLSKCLSLGYRAIMTTAVKPAFCDLKMCELANESHLGLDGAIGYHALRVLGITDFLTEDHRVVRTMVCQNSWGESWGSDGLCHIDATNIGRVVNTINVFRVQ